MIIKMHQALDLSTLYESIKDYKMPIKTAYKFNKLMRQLEKELGFYRAQVASLLDEYASRDGNGAYEYTSDGTAVKIIKGKEQECNKKFTDLLDLDVQLEGITFDLDELDEIELTISQLNSLMLLMSE